MSKSSCCALGLLCALALAVPAAAAVSGNASETAVAGGWFADQLQLSLQPGEPTSRDYVMAEAEFVAYGYGYLQRVERNGREIELYFRQVCVIWCHIDQTFQFEIPIGRLEPGGWTLAPFINDQAQPDANLDFVVGAEASRAGLIVRPAAPTQAELVRLQVPYQVPACESHPSLGSVEQSGNLLRLELTAGARLPDCVDADGAAEVGSFLVQLGSLAPGNYQVELWGLPAEPTEPPTAPIQLDDLAFTVAPTATVDLLGRYRVGIAWRAPDGATGTAKPVAGGSEESALFSFFNADNWEVMVKVLDGCAINGNRWIFLSAATDVEFTLTVADLESDAAPYIHTSGPGLAPPLADTAAFARSP
jgi:hypothetical protein